MPGKRCCVPSCPYSPSQSYYRFPHPLRDEAVFKSWVTLIGNVTVANAESMRVYENYRICGKHFNETAFNRNNRLRREALPQYHLPAGVSFFVLPRRDPQRRNQWIKNIKREGLTRNAVVCEKHFTEDQFENRSDRKLKWNAIPTIFDFKKLQKPKSRKLRKLGASSDLVNDATTEKSTSALDETQAAAEQMMVEVKEEPEEEVDESFWTNPHFTSLQGYFGEEKSLTEICRICLLAVRNDEYQTLTSDQTHSLNEIQHKVKFVLSDIKLDVFSNSVVCNNCIELINYSFELQEKWLLSQERLCQIIDKKKTDKIKGTDIIIMVDPPTIEMEKPIVFEVVEDDADNDETLNINDAIMVSHQDTGSDNISLQQYKDEILPTVNQPSVLDPSESKQPMQTKEKDYSLCITCNVCRQSYSSIKRYAIHSSRHVQTKNKCFRCKTILENENKLYIHLMQCLKNDIDQGLLFRKSATYMCANCKKQFLFSWYLEQHSKVCTQKNLG